MIITGLGVACWDPRFTSPRLQVSKLDLRADSCVTLEVNGDLNDGGVSNRVVWPPSSENSFAIHWLHCRLTCETGAAAAD